MNSQGIFSIFRMYNYKTGLIIYAPLHNVKLKHIDRKIIKKIITYIKMNDEIRNYHNQQ